MSAISDQINNIYMIDYRPEILINTSRFSAKDYNGVSLLKGFLIILVIWGHLIPEGVFGNITAYLIYSFHMPLFMGLSGYLIKSKFIVNSSFQNLWSKYAKRLLLSWAIAWFVYAILEFTVAKRFTTIQDLINFLIFPDMHLWYVPALLVYINVLFFFKKMGWPDWKILLLSFVVSILTVYNFEYVHVWTDWYQTIPGNIYRTYRPHFFLFFMLGYSIKTFQLEKKNANILKIGVVLLFGMRFLNFYLPSLNRPMFTWDFYLLNLFLIVLILPYFNNAYQFDFQIKTKPKLKWIYYPIMWIGINSLHIYLWHALLRYVRFI